MHALTLHTLGQPLQLQEQTPAELKEGYARIR